MTLRMILTALIPASSHLRGHRDHGDNGHLLDGHGRVEELVDCHVHSAEDVAALAAGGAEAAGARHALDAVAAKGRALGFAAGLARTKAEEAAVDRSGALDELQLLELSADFVMRDAEDVGAEDGVALERFGVEHGVEDGVDDADRALGAQRDLEALWLQASRRLGERGVADGEQHRVVERLQQTTEDLLAALRAVPPLEAEPLRLWLAD